MQVESDDGLDGIVAKEVDDRDADFIAALDPDTVLKLLNVVEEAHKLIPDHDRQGAGRYAALKAALEALDGDA
jgi:hypothetical protein